MADSAQPADYNPGDFCPFAVTVDIVLLTIQDDQLQVLLIRRGAPPFEGKWALPGGFVLPKEDLEAAARRELFEETRVEAGPEYLRQLGAYGHPDRDPRMRVVTTAWWAVMRDVPKPHAGTDASHAELVPVSEIENRRIALAFDHEQIVRDALEAVRVELERTTLATAFVGDEFRVSDLRRVYEAVWNTELEPANFQRRMRSEKVFEATGEHAPSAGRPAELFRSVLRNEVVPLEPPFRRPRSEDED